MRVIISLLIALAISASYWVAVQRGKVTGSGGTISPSATEIFNLRSKCTELAEIIMVQNPASSVINPRVLSHLDPRTARCYVELDNDYSRRLFDGQTGERLAEFWNGPVPSTYVKGVENPSPDATRAFIDARMANDRK